MTSYYARARPHTRTHMRAAEHVVIPSHPCTLVLRLGLTLTDSVRFKPAIAAFSHVGYDTYPGTRKSYLDTRLVTTLHFLDSST